MAANAEGASPPVFDQIFRNARFAQGGNALFEGRVKGNPKPQVIWTRKGLQMKGTEKHQMLYDENSGKVSLLIKSIGPGDEGEYTCTALNPYGEAICTVYISPEATKQVKKSRSGHKLHKSSSNKQVQMVQQQQQTQQQQKQQFGVQQQNVMQHQQHQTSGYQQQQQQSFQQSSASSFQQSASFSQESSSSTQQFSSSQEMSTVKQTSSSSFNQFGVQQQQIVSNDEDDQTLIPKFVSCSGNIEAFEGDQVRVNARVTGRPAPDIKWYLNSETPLVQDDSHKLLINETGCHTLLFTSIKMSEAGIIKCIATNRSGQATFQCNLAVKSKTETCSPHFGEKLQNCKVELGENLTLSVKAVGRPIPKLSWLKDGSALVSSDNVRVTFEEDGRSTIHISNADKRNDGWYQVSAFNSKGSAITRARIQVNYQKDASVKDFSYSREETYRINRPIGKLLEPEQESEPEVIYLKHVERAQQHQKPHETESKFGPPSFVTPMRDAVIFEGEKCHFDAKVMPVGDPSMRVEWLFNGKPIPASSRMNSSCQFGFVSLDMLNSATSDSGEYTCVVTNEAGRVHCSCRLLVNVKKEVETEFRHATKQMEQTITETRLKEIKEPPPPQPEFVKPLVGIGEKPEGSNVHLEAQINPVSDHTMKIEWFKDGKAITASSRIGTIFNFGYVSLNINGLRVEDAGTYTCRATNVSGEAVTSTTLHVKITQDLTSSTGISEQQQYIEKVQQLEQYQATKNLKRTESVIEPTSAPEFKTKLKNQTDIREGGFAHFEARLEPMGDETMKVEWRKDGQLVEASSRITSFFNFGYVALTIKQVASHDAGHYTCTAYNTKGRAETSATLSTSVNVDSEFQSKSWSSIQKLESTKSSTSATLAQPEVTTPPTFVSQLKGTNVILEGQRAHFECRIEPQNDPNLSVHWLHNGSQLQASSRIQTYNDFGYVAFDILDVKKEDAGVYTLIVNNLLGQQQTNVELKVMNHNDSVDYSTIHSRAVEETKKFEAKQQHSTVVQGTEKVCTSAPVFRTPLQNPRPVTEGQNIHLEARLEPIGDPTMKVEWLFNDRSLTVGSRFKTYNDFGFIALDIIGVNAQDSGMYTCRATNQLGTAQTTAKVEVHVKSSVITETENEASLQQINYLESSEKYQQMMVEDNEPKQPPSFVKNLHNVEIVEGKNVHLEARVHPIGDSTMKIEWTVNGKPLKAGHKIRPAYDFDYVALDLLSVYPEDSGLYTCTARNAFGEAQSSATVKVTPTTEVTMDSKTAQNLQRLNLLEQRSVARLSHKHGDLDEDLDQFLESPHFVTQPKDIPHMVEGKNAHFEAKLEPLTDPNLTVEWFKNGKPVTVGHRFRPIHDFGYVALDIVGVISEDSGTYTCKATNLAGSCLCQAVLNCQSGKQIVSESNSEMSQFQMLEHKKMSGRHEIDEEITTQAPVFTTSMKSVEIKEGQRAHFECRIIPVSDPTLKVQWLHNNKPIKQATRIKEGLDFGFVSLDIMHAYPDDAGTYTCRAVNKLGEAINSVELIVKAKETIIKDTMHQAAMSQIQHLEQAHVAQTQDEGLTTQIPNFTSGMKDLVLLEGTSAHFEAKLVPIGDPKLRVEWLHDGKPIQASNRMSTLHDFGFVALDLKYTRPEDSGTYTCRAVNALGEATVSATMQIVSAQNGPMGETMHEDALQKIANLEQKRYVSHVMEDEVVQSAPVFVVPLQGKTELVEGQNIHMECRIEPYPDSSLRVEWLHNGKPLPFGNRWRTSYDFGFAALDIIGCYPEDSGIYTLRATNSLGMTESHIEFKVSSRSGLLLDSEHIDALEKIKYLESRRRREKEEESIVTEGPQFGHVLRDLKLDEGQPAHFETTLTPVNDANMKVEWLYNGKPIPQGHRFRTTYDFGFVALDILYAYPEDSGSYTCVAKNAIGEQSTSCNLTVKGKASLLLDTMDRERLTHLRNLENKPDYRTEQGEIKLVKPVFTTPLNNSEGIPEQSHVHLECRLEPVNDPNLKVEWFVEGKAIQTGHRFRTTHDFGYVALDILYAYSEDSGTYICKATNKLGEAVNTCSVSIVGKKSLLLDSQHAESWQKIQHLESRNQQSRLQVVDLPVGPPRFITELMGKTTLSEGQNAHFEAQVEPINDPNLKIEFTHNGKPLMQASRIHTLCDFGYVALDIAQLIVDDKGEYICRIYNSHGEVSSKINLNISGRDTLDMSSQRPEGLEKIRELESRKQRERHEELVTFQKPVFTQALLNVEKEENQSAHLEARLIPIGDPSLKVEWFKDGNLISSGSRINTLHDFGFVSLDITGLRASDEGVYECRAINSLGEATTTATIKVATKGSLILDSQHPEGMRKITALESSKLKHQISENESEFEKPTFVSTLTGTSEVQEGQRAHMECRVVPLGDPNLKFSWFKNGESLTTGSRIQATQDFGFVTLDIASCIPEDSGMYTVKAYNLVGEASTSFALRVGDKSGIMKDALQPDSLKRIQELEAHRNQKKKRTEDTLISQPPVFMQPLQDVGAIAEGQNIHVEASIEPRNDPDLKVDWEFNGKPLQSGSRIKTTLDFGHVQLFINGVRGDDSGLYTCKATNALGDAVSTTHIKVEESISVSGQSQYPSAMKKIKNLEAQKVKEDIKDMTFGTPQFVEHLNNVSCAEQDTAKFFCQVEPNRDPSLKIEWLLNGVPIPLASRFEPNVSLGNISLTIKTCLVSDSGIISCVVTNSQAKVTSTGSLTVNPVKTSFDNEGPKFTTPLPQEIIIRESETAFRLETFVEPRKDDKLTIDWYHNGIPVSSSSRIKPSFDFGQAVLVVEDLSMRDQGVYTCNAKNNYGEATTFTSIKCTKFEGLDLSTKHPKGLAGLEAISELENNKFNAELSMENVDEEERGRAPKFVTPFFDSIASEGDTVLFQARVEPVRDSKINIQWTHDGEILGESSRFTKVLSFGMAILEIKNVTLRDFGTYVCTASNNFGSDSLDVKLSYRDEFSSEKPKFTTKIKDVIDLKDGDSVHFECNLTPVHDPDLKIEWSFNGKPIHHSSRLKTVCDFGFVTLDIAGVDSRDSGIYKCRAYNKYGEDTTEATVKCEAKSGVYYDSLQPKSLSKIKDLETETNASNHATVEVKEAPKFLSQISSKISVSEGQSAHFEAKLSPAEDPDLKVEWYKDGKPLSMGHRFRTFHDFGIVILDILYTYEEDQGVYECRATNKFGSDVTKGTIECSSKSNLILTPQVPGEMKQSTLDHIHHLESMKLRTKTSVSGTHNVAPRFTLPIHNIEDLREAESAHFEARLIPTDDPNLTVEWFWNGKALKAGSRIRTFCDFGFVILEISPVYPEDSGEYMCKAKNAMGEAVTSATLKCSGKRNLIMDSQLPKGMEGAIDKIAYLEGLGKSRQITDTNDDLGNPPEFIVNLQDLLLAENSLAHFETRMTPINDPSMRVEWYHNGKQLSAGSRIKTINDFGFVILEVANVMTRDSGNYTCKATNKHGEASVSCNVTVKSKQSIITDPQLPRSFRSGTESIQRLEENLWKRGEERIPEEAVGHPPKFVTQIRDVTLIEGQAAHFDCRVEPVGDGSMKIEWFHESNPLCIGSRIHTLSDFGFIVLDIDWTFKRDSGTYICRATNKYGMSESRATLSVKSKKDINLDTQLPPGMSLDRLKELEKGKIESRLEEEEKISAPKFITQLESRAVGEGEPAHFNCRVEPKNDPKLVIKWYFNDKELSSGHRFRITHEFGYVALDILYTYPEDEGEYVCKAKNDLGEDITKCTLKCKELPAIQLEHQIPKGMKKSDYLVQMEASMKKYSQEMQLTEDDVYDAEKRQPPRFVTLIQSITDLVEMQAAKFECQLAPVGDPNMKVEWFFNGKPLPFKNRFTPIYDFGYVAMNFGWVYPEDSGEYVCKATNLYGMDETRAIIKTSGKPGIIFESQLPKGMASIERIREMESGWQRAPELIESETEKFKPCFVTTPEPQEVQEGDWARFCCRVTGYPKPRVMWLLNGHTVINGSKHKLVYDGMWHFDIPKCRDIDAGKVEVIARNQCGEAYAVTSLTVKPRADDFRSVLKHNVKPWYEEDEAEIQRQLEVLRKQSIRQSQRKAKTSHKVREMHQAQKQQQLQVEQLTEWQEMVKREKKHAEYASSSHFSSKNMCAPIFTNFLEPISVSKGSEAKLTVTFEGNPPPAVKWFRYGFNIKDSKEFKILTGETNSTLIIASANVEDSGIFTCLLENIGGSSKSSTNLNVVEHDGINTAAHRESSSTSKTSIVKTVKSSSSTSSSSTTKEMRVSKGDTIRFDIQFKDGDKSQLKFLFEGKEIKEDSNRVKISVKNNVASLAIENADTEKHTGMYECIMDAPGGKATCKIFCRVIEK